MILPAPLRGVEIGQLLEVAPIEVERVLRDRCGFAAAAHVSLPVLTSQRSAGFVGD
jgi:hypothetical protein